MKKTWINGFLAVAVLGGLFTFTAAQAYFTADPFTKEPSLLTVTNTSNSLGSFLFPAASTSKVFSFKIYNKKSQPVQIDQINARLVTSCNATENFTSECYLNFTPFQCTLKNDNPFVQYSLATATVQSSPSWSNEVEIPFHVLGANNAPLVLQPYQTLPLVMECGLSGFKQYDPTKSYWTARFGLKGPKSIHLTYNNIPSVGSSATIGGLSFPINGPLYHN